MIPFPILTHLSVIYSPHILWSFEITWLVFFEVTICRLLSKYGSVKSSWSKLQHGFTKTFNKIQIWKPSYTLELVGKNPKIKTIIIIKWSEWKCGRSSPQHWWPWPSCPGRESSWWRPSASSPSMENQVQIDYNVHLGWNTLYNCFKIKKCQRWAMS